MPSLQPPCTGSESSGRPARLRWTLSPYWAVRLTLALLFVLAGCSLTLLAQRVGSTQLERERALHATALEQAARQHLALLQIGRMAATVDTASGPALPVAAVALSKEVAHAGEQALLLDALVAPHIAEPHDPVLARALAQWQAVREVIWYRGQLVAAHAGQVDGVPLPDTLAALQTEIDRALVLANQLSEALRANDTQHIQALRKELRLATATMLVLLCLIALAVLEPAARLVQRRTLQRAEQAAELERLALVAEHTQAMVIITDRYDRIQWVNDAFTRLTGWSLAEALGRWPRELLRRGQAVPGKFDPLDSALAKGEGVRVEVPLRARDGNVLWADVDLRPLHDANGALTGFVSVSTDVTDRQRQRQKLSALWAALPVGVVVHDERGQVADANRAAERLMGLSLAQLQGRDPTDPRWRAVCVDGSPYPVEEYPAVRTLRTGQAFPNETIGIQLPDGELRWLQVNTEPQFDAPGQVSGVVACFSDVTESRRLQEQLRATARTDALTNLPNRAEVMDRLKHAIDHAERHPGYGFAVLFMDFDRFKQVNDTLGHAAGDALLRQVSERLRQALRPGDALARVPSQMHVAARIGGDEFVVVLDGMNQLDDVLGVANRLLTDLCAPYDLDGQLVQSSASIGIVLSDGQPTTAEDVLRNADTAMYEAKRAGRARCVVFDSSMHERVVHTLGVESDLRTALKDEQIFVVYQPVVDLADGSLVGVEALVRWRHPQRGLVPPLAFISIAEECGLIDALGRRVLTLACTQFMQWQQDLGAKAPAELAVNLSRAQLKRGDVVDEVRRLLQETGMSPRQLQLEITETLAAQDERIQQTLRDLKALGVTLALDDFGTGYSSLACLHQLPVDTVKIDRSFVKHAETVEYHRVLIEATIRMARALGMRTVAEGIETPGQARLMRQLLCDRSQGYLHGHPMTAEDLQRWVRGGVPMVPTDWAGREASPSPVAAAAD